MDLLALPLSSASRHWIGGVGRKAVRRLVIAACWNGVVVVGATTWAMSYAQQAFSASTAALVYAMEPVCASVLAAIFLGETLEPLQLLGGVLVILANVIAARSN